ncbi:hypothetical protein JXR93_13725 [bacterium]|nr:hypothetical protein [bacterium]
MRNKLIELIKYYSDYDNTKWKIVERSRWEIEYYYSDLNSDISVMFYESNHPYDGDAWKLSFRYKNSQVEGGTHSNPMFKYNGDNNFIDLIKRVFIIN